MSNRRLERVSRALKQVVSETIVAKLKDPRAGFITVTDVTVAPDLRTATVKVSVIGDEADERTTLRGLRHAHGFFQETVSRELDLRFCPKISFEIDRAVKRSARIAELLRAERDELGEAAEEGEEGDETDGQDHPGQDTA
jgi:ribosome-binding factor A